MRSYLGTLITAIAMATGCASDPLPEPSRAVQVRPECPARTDSAFYFPSEATDGQAVEYPSQFLGEINAPSLSCGTGVDEGYRITRLAPGRPSDVIEVVHSHDGWTLRGFEFASAVYHQRAAITKEVRKSLTDTQASEVGKLFAETGFWRTQPLPPNVKDISYEGPWVTLEARRRSSYHVVFPLAQSFSTVTARLFDMAGLDIR